MGKMGLHVYKIYPDGAKTSRLRKIPKIRSHNFRLIASVPPIWEQANRGKTTTLIVIEPTKCLTFFILCVYTNDRENKKHVYI